MAKELPYFKFYVSEWNDGDITLEDFETQGLFINLCAYYWSNECEITYTKAKKKFRSANIDCFNNLIDAGIIKLENDLLTINFLDEQKNERKETSKTRSKGGKASAEARRLKKLAEEQAKPTQNQHELNTSSTENEHVLNSSSTQTQLLREEERREEKKREDKSKEDKSKELATAKAVAPTLEERKNIFDLEVLRLAEEMQMLPDTAKAFSDYWTEHNAGGKKMLFEMKKVFDVKRRMATWQKNEQKFKGNQMTGAESVGTVTDFMNGI